MQKGKYATDKTFYILEFLFMSFATTSKMQGNLGKG